MIKQILDWVQAAQWKDLQSSGRRSASVGVNFVPLMMLIKLLRQRLTERSVVLNWPWSPFMAAVGDLDHHQDTHSDTCDPPGTFDI